MSFTSFDSTTLPLAKPTITEPPYHFLQSQISPVSPWT